MGDNAVERRLRELIGHLLVSQEEERRRLASALHDDFSQQLALLAIDLEQLRLQPPSSPTELTSKLQELSGRTNGISSRVYRLSHELRPAKLEALGLFATVLGYCEEVSGQHGVTVTFTDQGREDAISAAVALCVYRITQEALDFVVQHRDATLARVHLAVDDCQLRLTIEDDGVGFDAATSSRGGLGLASMHERLHAVGGDLRVESTVSRGARLEIRIPLGVDVAPEGKP
jgi:two-component system sensor histidine kinase UhpB